MNYKQLIGLIALLAATSAYAACTMTTVIDPNTGQIKMCTQCCDASGMCSVVCN